MRPGSASILALFIAITLGGPILLGLIGALRRRGATIQGHGEPRPWDWRLVASSTLLYAFAFSLVFIIQEVFLVAPKALTPGLHPTLYHNNHSWTGDNPLARLFQGTGALAILTVGLAAMAWSARTSTRSWSLRLLGLWIAYHGLYQSLPQLVAGAILPGNDVGMAMDYLQLGPGARFCAALAAMVAFPVAGAVLGHGMLALGGREKAAQTNAPLFLLQTATVPAVLALPLIFLFRLPGTWDQVFLVPVVVSLVGVLWMQASAWWPARRPALALTGRASPWPALGAVLVLLALFQIVLRPGIAF